MNESWEYKIWMSSMNIHETYVRFVLIKTHLSGDAYEMHSQLHSEGHLISLSNLNLLGLFSTERGKRDLENEIID